MLNEFRKTNITWDKATQKIHETIAAHGSDNNGRTLVVKVVNGLNPQDYSEGIVEDLTGASLSLYWETSDKKKNGLDVFTPLNATKGEFELFYTTGMLSNPGILNCVLVLTDSVGKVVSDWFKINIIRPIDEDAIEADNSFTALTQALIDVSNLEQNYAPRLNDLTAQLQQTEQELSSQLAHKAEQSDLIVERERINTFTSLQGGSTTGDAELEDGRVGANGRTYSNIGGAVRGQIGELRDALEFKDITFTDGFNIDVGTTIGNTVNLTPKTASTWSYAVIDCSERSVFTVSGYGTGSTPLWSFVDKDNKLLSYSSSTTGRNVSVTVPENAVKIVINSRTANLSNGTNKYADGTATFKHVDDINNRLSETDYLTDVKNVEFTEGFNISIGSTLGYQIDLELNPVASWSYAIVPCRPGTPFIVSGYGSGTAKMYGFLDVNNRVLEYATSTTYKNHYVTAPKRTAKVVINSLTNSLSNGDNKYSSAAAYGIAEALKYKTTLDEPTADMTLSTFVNGKKFSDELQSPIADFGKPGDYFMHVPTHKIINDVVYMTYYANTRSGNEEPSEMTARFVYAPLSDLANKTYIDLQDVGDMYDGMTVTAIYDTILMAKDSETLYLMWTAELDGEYYRLYRTFTISTGTLSGVMKNTFSVNGNSADFNVSNMEMLLDNAGIDYPAMIVDIGIMQKLSSRIENGTTYYYTGCYNKGFNCIIKSADLVDWEFVSTPDFESFANFENAVYVIGDICYYFLRQGHEYHTGILTSYDLNTGTWRTPVYVSDTQSRSDFLEFDGELYLVHAPVDRYHISIMKINKKNLNKSYEVQTARVPFYFYPYMDSYNGELYMSYTDAYKHIQLAKFTIESIDHDTIGNQILTLVTS